MIVCHKYRFIFIKTGKTAGTSIEVFLSQHCGPADIVTPIYPHVESHVPRNFAGYFNPVPEIYSLRGKFIKNSIKEVINRRRFYNHISSLRVRSRISRDIWQNYFKFCVERNPWDKTVSDYYMQRWRSGAQLSFDTYLSRRQFCLNYPLYTDRQNNILLDWIVRYEHLTDELNEIFKRLGIPFSGSLGVKAKSEYRADRGRPYQEMYTNEQENIIRNAFEVEIRMHKYEF
jgi:hypothetical protein